ncbi:MAG: LytTR family DNA-binding domain-containing protein [Eubacteriales bacterium]|nr:LytTR family DNA-binding domain-containing protein [Eubacteriales bacterium]
MLYFAIVEDHDSERQLLRRYLEAWAKSHGEELVIREYPTAEAFDFDYSQDKRVDCALLDIQMPGKSGVELARSLREKDQNLALIFITGIVDYIQEGYELEALHYLLKPVKEAELARCLDRFIEKRKTMPASILVKTDDAYLKVQVDEILYLESERNFLSLHLKNQRILLTRAALQDFKNELGDSFLICHRSYLVNLKEVEQIVGRELILSSGERIPISRRKLTEVNDAFIRQHKKGASI